MTMARDHIPGYDTTDCVSEPRCLCRGEVGYNLHAFEYYTPCEIFLCEACSKQGSQLRSFSQGMKTEKMQKTSKKEKSEGSKQVGSRACEFAEVKDPLVDKTEPDQTPVPNSRDQSISTNNELTQLNSEASINQIGVEETQINSLCKQLLLPSDTNLECFSFDRVKSERHSYQINEAKENCVPNIPDTIPCVHPLNSPREIQSTYGTTLFHVKQILRKLTNGHDQFAESEYNAVSKINPAIN